MMSQVTAPQLDQILRSMIPIAPVIKQMAAAANVQSVNHGNGGQSLRGGQSVVPKVVYPSQFMSNLVMPQVHLSPLMRGRPFSDNEDN